MKKIFLYSFIQLCSIVSINSQHYSEKLDSAYSLLRSDLASAKDFTLALLDEALKDNDLETIVKANYILGYIEEIGKDFGKSVIYYLEAIRYADKADYEGIHKDQISVRKNIANIFRTFKANGLATKYNLEALQIALASNDKKQVLNLYLNQGLVYQSSKDYPKSIEFFQKIMELGEGYKKFEATNQIGLVYLDSKEYEKATQYFKMLDNIPEEHIIFKAKAYHNLAEISYETGAIEHSINSLRSSIQIKEENSTDKYSLFLSYRNIGNYLMQEEELDEAEKFLKLGETIALVSKKDPETFKVYQYLASLYLKKGKTELSSEYQNKYYQEVQDYLNMQEEVQRQDKEYNFDLITKRYFDEVKNQERIASITLTSKISIGSLLTILLLTVSYYRLEKIKLRRNIERELATFGVYED